MRITGGAYRGRNIKAPQGMATRPTTDRVREALFNLLSHHDWGEGIGDPLNGTIVLDAFAGTGALGIEALSRGAAEAFFFEQNRKAFAALKENIALTADKEVQLFARDVLKPPPAPKAATLVFLDPPYKKNLIPPLLEILDENGWLADNALIIAETAKTEDLDLPDYDLLLEKRYGDTKLHFFTCQKAS